VQAGVHHSRGNYFLLRDGSGPGARQALDAYRRGLALVLEVQALQPNDVLRKREAAAFRESIGFALYRAGDLAAAEDELRQALASHREQSAGDPSNANIRLDVASSTIALAAVQLDLGNAAEAASASGRAVALLEALPQGLRDDRYTKKTLPEGYYVWGRALAMQQRSGAQPHDDVPARQACQHLRLASGMLDELANQGGLEPGRLQAAQVRAAMRDCQP
jgi:tetratricopeptide (TPR) repeat protein